RRCPGRWRRRWGCAASAAELQIVQHRIVIGGGYKHRMGRARQGRGWEGAWESNPPPVMGGDYLLGWQHNELVVGTEIKTRSLAPQRAPDWRAAFDRRLAPTPPR